jgi:hypothetical protein
MTPLCFLKDDVIPERSKFPDIENIKLAADDSFS